MKFAVVIFACVLAAVSAQTTPQYNRNTYDPFGYYNRNQYNNNQYNKYDPFRQFNRNRYDTYKPYSTPAPYRPFVTVTTPAPVVASTRIPVTPAPAVVSPVPVIPVARVSSDARNAAIVKYGNEINPDGSYNYFYETDNGIAAQEQGVPRNFGGSPPVAPDVAQGSFSWTSPEGVPVQITYVADENGYQPSGAAIPTPPPVPPQILRALEYISKNYVVKK